MNTVLLILSWIIVIGFVTGIPLAFVYFAGWDALLIFIGLLVLAVIFALALHKIIRGW